MEALETPMEALEAPTEALEALEAPTEATPTMTIIMLLLSIFARIGVRTTSKESRNKCAWALPLTELVFATNADLNRQPAKPSAVPHAVLSEQPLVVSVTRASTPWSTSTTAVDVTYLAQSTPCAVVDFALLLATSVSVDVLTFNRLVRLDALADLTLSTWDNATEQSTVTPLDSLHVPATVTAPLVIFVTPEVAAPT